jgi:hypothetical protein
MSTTDGTGGEDALPSADHEAELGNGPVVSGEASDRQAVAAGQREYEAATARWFSATVEKIMRTDPIYAQITHERVESVPDLVVNISEDQDMHVTPSCFTAGGDISVPGIIEGDLDDVHAIVVSASDQMLAQVMTTLFAQIQEATDRVGNTVQAGEDLVEDFLEGLSKMQVTFNEAGRPAFQMVVAPDSAARVRAAMDNATPGQIRRFEEIMRQKREEFDATRRRRRLPRHGN